MHISNKTWIYILSLLFFNGLLSGMKSPKILWGAPQEVQYFPKEMIEEILGKIIDEFENLEDEIAAENVYKKLVQISKTNKEIHNLLFGDSETAIKLAKAITKRVFKFRDKNPNKLILHAAAENDYVLIAQWLIRNDYPPNTQRKLDKRTPLHIAASHNAKRVTKLLINNKVNIDALDIAGFTPLTLAALGGNLEMAKLLIEDGKAKIRPYDMEIAASAKRPEIVAYFIKKNENLKNNKSMATSLTPLHAAALNNALKVVNVLIQHKANPCLKTNEGELAIDLAKTPEMQKLLQDYMNTYKCEN